VTYKLLVLAPSTGGKSTLMRYLRENTGLHIAETDEEVMKANNDIWPDDELKNTVLVPQTTKEIISRDSVIYFASYIPKELIREARQKGFTILLMKIGIAELATRNKKRMSVEGYRDVSPYFEMQLEAFAQLESESLIDKTIDGERSVEEIAREISQLAVI
jgi:predicted ABC-type ATPase